MTDQERDIAYYTHAVEYHRREIEIQKDALAKAERSLALALERLKENESKGNNKN
jgi:hypothetical protein